MLLLLLLLLLLRDEMNEAELLLLLVRIGDVKAEVENTDAYDRLSLPEKHTTDPAATAEINNCRRQ